MKVDINVGAKRRELKDFIRLVLSFFFCLVLMAFYQNIRLYTAGVLDAVINKSVFILIIHHLGFTSLVALVLAFLFNFLERIKPNLGFKAITAILLLLLLCEGLLTNYYVQYYEILGSGLIDFIQDQEAVDLIYTMPLFLVSCALGMYFFYRIAKNFYTLINRMYPFTIILFSLFLATLVSRKNPVNENKTQHLIQYQANYLLDFNKYEGGLEYPLMQPFDPPNELADYFNFKEKAPNFIFIVMDGVGADFVGDKAKFKTFMPQVNALVESSLYWPNFISNTGESVASIPTIFGSLPFGQDGFTNITSSTNRTTLFQLLKNKGYQSNFYFGGNSSLDNLGKFLFDEEIDLLVDRTAFGPNYEQQETDAAGISLGYPDAGLFGKWQNDFESTFRPRLDVFLTQSTKNPFLIPDANIYEDEVENKLKDAAISDRNIRLIEKNKEIFASLLYTDKAIGQFIIDYKKKAEYQNTIFIITGSHNMADLPQADNLGRYRVPFLIFSPLLKSAEKINSMVAHTDILPSLAGLLHSTFETEIPEQVSWLGEGLIHQNMFKPGKKIPLYRHQKNIQDFVEGQYCYSKSSFYKIGADLSLYRPDSDAMEPVLEASFKEFKAINTYVTSNDKIYRENTGNEKVESFVANKSDMVWINSVFNSDDYDKAYETARDLAIEGNRDRALLLCQHILERVPGHADTEILMGRIYAWNKDYNKAARILETAIKKYPVYADGYAALLDVYFWSDSNFKVEGIKKLIQKHRIGNEALREKIKRAETKLKEDNVLFESSNLGYLNFEDEGYE